MFADGWTGKTAGTVWYYEPSLTSLLIEVVADGVKVLMPSLAHATCWDEILTSKDRLHQQPVKRGLLASKLHREMEIYTFSTETCFRSAIER